MRLTIVQAHVELAQRIADQYATIPTVTAVSIAGSVVFGTAVVDSDIDLYVYSDEPISVADRDRLFTPQASHMELNNQFWETGDEWQDAATGIHVDVMYRDLAWVGGMQKRVLDEHQASVGYSTCFWHNVLHSQVLYDRDGRYQQLQAAAKRPYPEPLVHAIIAKNYPILRDNQSAYYYQIKKAVKRDDLVSVNHRAAAFLASYFDILIAINRLPHPGEKRMVQFVAERCEKRPSNFATDINAFLHATIKSDLSILNYLNVLVDKLDTILEQANLNL
ncbi:MAG: DUF4037 domain-containing protein [Chloroflexi bacterium]|nr:DUF4037 domain-containing protein [Chloroflexota bacterium]